MRYKRRGRPPGRDRFGGTGVRSKRCARTKTTSHLASNQTNVIRHHRAALFGGWMKWPGVGAEAPCENQLMRYK
jgi:hypothetical protein